MVNIEGAVAFITGGASGMGLGMARVFSRAGMRVVIADIRQDAIDAALRQFPAGNPGVVGVQLSFPTDAAPPERVTAEAVVVRNPLFVAERARRLAQR